MSEHRTVEKLPVLELVSATMFPAIGEFIVREKVRVGEVIDGIKIGSVSKNFRAVFLDEIEEATEGAELRRHVLKEAALDLTILSELDGEKAKVTFGQFWEVLKTIQKSSCIAYARKKGGLWVVSSNWFSSVSDGLHLGAILVDYKYVSCPWNAGLQVVSHG